MSVRWGAGFPPKSLSSPPTSPTGFVLIPSPVILLSHLLSPVHIGQSVCVCVCVCVTGATGMHAQCPLKPFVLQIYTVLPLFPMPISPLLVRQCMQCRAYNGRTRIGSFPLLTLPSEVSEVYSSRCFFTAQGFFFSQSVRDSCSRPRSCESSLRISFWILLGFLRSLSWLMHALVRWNIRQE